MPAVVAEAREAISDSEDFAVCAALPRQQRKTEMQGRAELKNNVPAMEEIQFHA